MGTSSSMPIAGTGADAGIDKSSSKIHVTDVPVSHVLNISGYSKSKGVAPREYISSSFTAAGHRWSIFYYPNGSGSTDTDAEYIALFVSCTDKDVKARSTLCLLDKDGEVAHTCKTQFYSHMSGVSRFISRWDLERPGHLQDDRFRIRFDISVLKLVPKKEDAAVAKFVDVPPPDVSQHLGDLLSSGDGADVMFEVDGESFSTHRTIHAARFRLKLICEEKLCSYIDTGSVGTMLAFADQRGCHGLQKACLNFLMSGGNLTAAVVTGGLEQVMSSFPSVKELLLKSCDEQLPLREGVALARS